MARRDVVEVTCDRCKRVESQLSSELPAQGGPEIEISFHGEKIIFHDLCKRCREAVEGYYNRVAKKTEDKVEAAVLGESSAQPSEPQAQEEVKKRGFLGRG